jgi:hypothetical protein
MHAQMLHYVIHFIQWILNTRMCQAVKCRRHTSMLDHQLLWSWIVLICGVGRR